MKNFLIPVLFILSFSAIADPFEDNLKELFELTGVRDDYAALNSIVINQMQKGFFQAAGQNIDGTSLTEDQKKQVGEVLKNRFTQMVKNYQDHMDKEMSYEDVENEVFIPLYKDAYTESEVEELIAFYKTPVGKKSVEVSQKISLQVTQKAAEKYDPIITKFVKTEIEEGIKLVKEEIAEKGIE